MSGTGPAGPGAGAADGDAELGRLLADGLGHHSGGPVDERRLLAGAQRGAVRIRKRRTLALGVATVLVVMLPVGTAVDRLSGAGREPAAEVAQPVSAQDAASPGSAGTVPKRPGGTDELMGSGPPAVGLGRTASGQVVIPDDALPTAGDLPRLTLARTSDTANRTPAPVPAAQDTCGILLSGTPEAAGSREVVLEQRTGVESAWWVLTGTVRVQARDGAATYLSAVRRLRCVEPVSVLTADAALVGRFRDEANRIHWYGVVRVGRTVSEVRLVAPSGNAPSRDEIERLLRAAAGRLADSGLVQAAETDPALR